MNAPPVLRPLRAILQRRLQIVHSRPIRTPYYLRASQYRFQRRYNSSIPPDQTPDPEESAQQGSNEQTPETGATPSADAVEEGKIATPEAVEEGAAEIAEAPQAEVEAVEVTSGGVTNFDIPGHDAASTPTVAAAVPRLDGLFVRSVFQQLKVIDEEIQAGIAEAVTRQLEADEASAAAAEVEAQEIAAPVQDIPEVADPISTDTVAATIADQVDGPVVQEPVVDESITATPEPAVQEVVSQAEADQTVTSKAIEAGTPQLETETTPSTEEMVAKEALETVVPTSSAEEGAAPKATASVTTLPDPVDSEHVVPEVSVSESKPSQDFIVEEVAAEAEAASTEHVLRGAQSGLADAQISQPEVSSATDSTRSPLGGSAEKSADEIDALRSVSEGESLATQSTPKDAPVEKPGNKTDNLDSALDEELSRKVRATTAAGKDKAPTAPGSEEGEGEQPSRLPRNVQAYYLQPLRRVAQYGVPSCDLQLRSYSVRPLESFCDFALRAAYYLGLPAYGPTPLPRIIQRWTVTRSNFIHKKSQENFERITRRRLIQIKDGHPETVQIWLAFLQKHQQAAVGMKANLWEFSSLDVAKEMDEALEDAAPVIKDKSRLLVQNREFATVEKVDEFLQSERYRLTGGQYTGGM